MKRAIPQFLAQFLAQSVALSLFLAATLPAPAHAWGREGHAVIATIAQAHLSPTANNQASLLLENEGLTQLADVASWADDVRRSRPETAPWHYVDIPLDAPLYDAARDCAGSECAVAKLEQFRTVLADPSATPAARLEALKWVVHLVADVHQPLHDEDHDDRGGNQVQILGYGRTLSLHAFWDTTMIAQDNPDASDLATALDAQITPAEVADWNRGTPEDWANQAHALARPAYTLLGNPAPGSSIEVPDSYVNTEQKVIELQLERAGVRLADVLNQALK